MRKTIGLSLALLLASSVAMAKSQSGQHQTAPAANAKPASVGAKAKTAKKPAASSRARGERKATSERKADRKLTARSERRHRSPKPQREKNRTAAALPHADHYIGPVRAAGVRQIGSATWYGGRHLGRRTASGEPLDAVRATAAHRTLPLHTLVRVTNLSNGRSVIAKINDRGPVSRALLIDMSPRAAEELDMKRAGIVEVAVEPVAPTGNVQIAAEPLPAPGNIGSSSER